MTDGIYADAGEFEGLTPYLGAKSRGVRVNGKGILKFAPRLRDPACAGEFGKRNLESRNHLRDLCVSAVKTYVALTGLGLFLHVSRASPLVEVFRPVGARAS